MSGGEEGFEFLLEEFFHPPKPLNLDGPDDYILRWKAAMMNGITQVSNASLLERLLDYTLDPNSTLSSVNYFDSVYWDVRSNRLYRGILLKFLLEHTSRIMEHVQKIHAEAPSFAWFNLVQLIGAAVEDDEEMGKVKQFFKERDMGFYRSFKEAEENTNRFMDFDEWTQKTVKSLEEGRQEYGVAAIKDQRMKVVLKDIGEWIENLPEK